MRGLIASVFCLLSIAANAATPCSFSNPTSCGSPGMNNAAIGGTLSVGGAATLSSTLGVSGAATFSAAGTALSVTNNATVGGTATVGGASNNALTITPGAAATNGINIAPSGTGAINLVTGGNASSVNIGNNSGGFGQALAITTNTGGNTSDGTNGNLVVAGARLQSQYYRLPGTTYNLSAALWRSPVLFQVNYTGSTTYSADVPVAWDFSIPTDTVQQSGGIQPITGMRVTQNIKAGARGNRIGFSSIINLINGDITGDTSTRSYQTTYNQAQASVNVGGTGTGSGQCAGFLYGGDQVILASGGTNWCLVNAGMEKDISVRTGASVRDAYGMSVALLSTNAVTPANDSTAFATIAQVGATPTLKHVQLIGSESGPWPMADAGTFFGTRYQTICGGNDKSCLIPPQHLTYGADLTRVNFTQQSGYPWYAPGSYIDGTGQGLFGGGLLLATTSTGYKIDVPNAQVVTSVAVATAGTATGNGLNSYRVGDEVTGTSTPPGQYKITHTKALGAAVVAAGSGGTNGSCKVVGTTGTGTKAIFNVTISGGAIASVDSVDTAGDYTVDPTGIGKTSGGVLNAEPVSNSSGCGAITGATLNMGMGALTLSTLVGGVFNACPGAGGITPVGGSGAGLTLTPTCAARSDIQLNTTGGEVVAGSGANVGSLGVTTGFFHFPFTNATSGAGGIPTGTPSSVSGNACIWNDVSFTLNCYSASAGAWKHVTFSAGAG